MPNSRQCGTSVKDRVAAIENHENTPVGKNNSVIQAKYVADVRGVNRYRHFHVPNLMNGVSSNGKDTSTHLPFLIRPGHIHYIDPDDKDSENGMEKGLRKKKKNVILPQLNASQMRVTKITRGKDFIREIEERAHAASEKTSSESDNSLKSNFSGIRLNDNLSSQQRKVSSGTRRTFASLGQRQNGMIITHPGNQNSLDVTLPPRSKSAQDLEARPEPSYEVPITPTYAILATPAPRDFKDMATQTSKNISTASVEFLNCGRATQTDSVPIVIVPRRKSEAPVNLQDIEERQALMEVIEDALGETFDRYSRVRTNQIIANSARRQAQIWRDAKDFLANNLFPQAIQAANKSSTRRKTAAEIVASIKMYP